MNSPIEKGAEAESPTAITGAVRPSPLRELSDLLGVEVVDVERFEGTKFRAWHLTVIRGQGEHRRAQRLPALRTADFKNARQLNWMAWQCGRSDDLPRLTRDDGRSALRLMHEHAEANGRVLTDGSIRARLRAGWEADHTQDAILEEKP